MRLRLLLALFISVTGCAACDEPDASTREGVDKQTCLSAELSPVEALAACTHFISAGDPHSLSYSNAYYNRGVAFAELEELQHARLDLVKALAMDPKNHWARQRLDFVEEKLANAKK
jgi:hypothetical protein